ncbi:MULTISPECIES: AraC family transcriptional regulator [Bradyrhizobium]|uniref:helix-turn-helix domain-containing protein n=1 Tax=Bradyrhizobium TaxID=374 RepID=UPI001CD7829C|nr:MULTISPECIES: AraC family transcriptional regulator [Bradyrhizobium]MCA1507416.1 helix-turn-helix transcriptional regulator [Bradyrhizobium sp. NBAIM02]MCA1524924.1 helix-turn-helix transcriptional regulator [Bradyrhizobium yuanmingense]
MASYKHKVLISIDDLPNISATELISSTSLPLPCRVSVSQTKALACSEHHRYSALFFIIMPRILRCSGPVSSHHAEHEMEANREFRGSDTHGILQRFGADIRASSEGFGWSSIYASIQRENPFEGRFEAIADDLIVLHRSGPVQTTFESGGHVTSRSIPRGSAFFLPAGHACKVGLHGALDTLHIYLRATLVGRERVNEVTPLLVERDVVLQHLAHAVEQALCEKASNSALFIDPIARALANRISTISRSSEPWQVQTAGLPEYQLRRLQDFIESNLEGEITLAAMASACGIGTKSFVRAFAATTGKSPYQYVIAARVERAKRLIEQNQQGLAEIALRCGFSHQEHLTRAFRRLTGQTPGRYRRGIN